MARDGSGTYSLYTPGNPVVTGTTISSSAFNNTLNDIASALTLSIASDGQTPITANIPMSSNKITGLGAGTATGDALAYGQSSALLTSATITTLTATTLTLGGSGVTVLNSGTYTPTLASISNLASSTPRVCQWMRIGNTVTVSGGFDAASTVGGNTSMSITLPVATGNFSGAFQAGGGGGSPPIALTIFATSGAQTVTANWVSSGTGASTFGFSFTFLVI